MTRLIDAGEIINRSHDVIIGNGTKHRCFDTTLIHEIPTVDAVPVIRCKDCEWQMSEWLVINHKPILNHYCSYHDYTDDLGDDDDFCSKAERREDDQTD